MTSFTYSFITFIIFFVFTFGLFGCSEDKKSGYSYRDERCAEYIAWKIRMDEARMRKDYREITRLISEVQNKGLSAEEYKRLCE